MRRLPNTWLPPRIVLPLSDDDVLAPRLCVVAVLGNDNRRCPDFVGDVTVNLELERFETDLPDAGGEQLLEAFLDDRMALCQRRILR